jgi:hypothetical protein
VIPDAGASWCLEALRKTPDEMGSKKGSVKIRRKRVVRQTTEKIGSSGWIRTSNPPVNRSDPDDRPSETKRDEGDENQ